MSDLLSPQDPDWALFKEQDPEWFLRASGEAIRDYTGWHLGPNEEETTICRLGQKGIIMLPSRHVTKVSEVVLVGEGSGTETVLTPDEYRVFEGGWIERGPFGDAYNAYYAGYAAGYARVTFNSGWDELPLVIKEVAYELTAATVQMSSGNVTAVQTMDYRVQLGQGGGNILNADQKSRLATYRLPPV